MASSTFRSLRSSCALVIVLAAMGPQWALAQPGVALYTIPVVFHVLHQNGPENIPEAQILDAMEELNAHFDEPTWEIDPPFDTIAADMDIAFTLASTAPDGSPTGGIDRIETPLTGNAGAPESYLNPWPRNRYLNIWIVATLDNNGVAYLTARPDEAAASPCTDGVMILHNYLGNIGTSSPYMPPLLSQAVGRFLNLKLLWEDPIDEAACGDDEVGDTPPCRIIDCCQLDSGMCYQIHPNTQNFMTGSYCQKMFTPGQRERVHACLNSPVAQRDELANGNAGDPGTCFTAVPEHAATRLVAYPVPFTDRIFLRNLPGTHGDLLLKDVSGRTVACTSALNGDGAFFVGPAIARGSYLLLVNDDRTTTALRVVKD